MKRERKITAKWVKTLLKHGKDGINHSPRESPLALFPLILFALERSEQRPGEPPATALPPARPRRAPLLSPDGAAAPGTDLRGEQEQSGAGVRLPNSKQGVWASSAGMHEVQGLQTSPGMCPAHPRTVLGTPPWMEHEPISKRC